MVPAVGRNRVFFAPRSLLAASGDRRGMVIRIVPATARRSPLILSPGWQLITGFPSAVLTFAWAASWLRSANMIRRSARAAPDAAMVGRRCDRSGRARGAISIDIYSFSAANNRVGVTSSS
jgi:hypothetical protein